MSDTTYLPSEQDLLRDEYDVWLDYGSPVLYDCFGRLVAVRAGSKILWLSLIERGRADRATKQRGILGHSLVHPLWLSLNLPKDWVTRWLDAPTHETAMLLGAGLEQGKSMAFWVYQQLCWLISCPLEHTPESYCKWAQAACRLASRKAERA